MTTTTPEASQAGGDAWLTVAEVAALQRVSRKTVLRWIAAGQLPAVRLGRHWRISQAQLDAYLQH